MVTAAQTNVDPAFAASLAADASKFIVTENKNQARSSPNQLKAEVWDWEWELQMIELLRKLDPVRAKRRGTGARPFRGAALAVGAVWILGAWPLATQVAAQARDPQGVINPLPVDPGVPKTPPDNPPNNEELGITVGSFRFYPTLDLRAGYDSNVFAQPSGQTTSGYFVFRPSLELRSDWNSHMLNFAADAGVGTYSNATSQNYQNYRVGADGRLDIQRDWYLTGKTGYSRTTEALGSPNAAFTTSPTVVETLPVEVGMYQRFNRFFYQLTGGASRFWYRDNSPLTSTGLAGSNRDRFEYGETLRAGYEILDGFDIWMQGGLSQRRYIQSVNSVNQQRDSNGWTATVGATIDLGGISKLEGFAGLTQQNYLSGSFSSTSALTFGLAGVWNGYEPLVVKPFIIRNINETAFTNFKNYVSTTIGAELLYTIRNDWQLNGGASYSMADYQPADGVAGATAHTDTFIRASIGLMYLVRPQIQIGPLYEYSSGSGSDATSPNYNRHIIMVRAVLKR